MNRLVSSVMPKPGFTVMSASDTRILQKIRGRATQLARGLFAVGVEVLPYELKGVIIDPSGTVLGGAGLGLPDMKVKTVVERTAQLAGELAGCLSLELSNPRLCIGIQIGGPVD